MLKLINRSLLAAASIVVISGTALADDAFWAEAAKAYEGATIRGVSESTLPSNYVKDVLAPEFEEATGIKV